jgi:nucleoside-diphosphate-sugar epimerase
LADDLARAAILAADTDAAAGRAYNVAHESAITQRSLVEALAAAAGKQAALVAAPRKRLVELGGNVFDPPFYFAQYYDMPPITLNTTRARQELAFEPASWEEGLRRTFAWYRAQERPAADFSFDDKALAELS